MSRGSSKDDCGKKTYILHRTVLQKDHRCLEAFGANDIVIPVGELEAIREKATAKTLDLGSWKFTVSFGECARNGSFREGIKTGGGGRIFLDSNGNNFEDLPSGIQRSDENRILLVAKKKVTEISQEEEKKKGAELTSDEKRRIRDSVIIVSNDTILAAIADLADIKTEEYRGEYFISNPSDLYTGMANLKVSLDYQEVANDHTRHNMLDAPKISKFVDLERLYPNQCCTFRFNDKMQYGIYKKAENVFRLIRNADSNNGKEGEYVSPKNMEHRFFEALVQDESIAFITVAGAAGTGKSVMMAKAALRMLDNDASHKMKVIVFRPLIGYETIGFLPGEYEDKINLCLAPFRDALCYAKSNGNFQGGQDINNKERALNAKKNGLSPEQSLKELIAEGLIQEDSVTFISGSTKHNAWLIGDDARNYDQHEMEALITRMGKNGRMLVSGDLAQMRRAFLHPTESGFAWAIESFKHSELAAHITFYEVLRHPFIEEVLKLRRR